MGVKHHQRKSSIPDVGSQAGNLSTSRSRARGRSLTPHPPRVGDALTKTIGGNPRSVLGRPQRRAMKHLFSFMRNKGAILLFSVAAEAMKPHPPNPNRPHPSGCLGLCCKPPKPGTLAAAAHDSKFKAW